MKVYNNHSIRTSQRSAIIESGQYSSLSRERTKKIYNTLKYVFDSANNGIRDYIPRSSSFVSHYDAVNFHRAAGR